MLLFLLNFVDTEKNTEIQRCQMKKKKDQITVLKKWLNKPGNSKAKLATILGYGTSETISRWIERNRIPYHQQVRLSLILKGDYDGTLKASHKG